MQKNRRGNNLWWRALVAVGMLGVQGWAADSALTTRVDSRDHGLTLTITVDLSQLRYDPADGGQLTLPGFTPSGPWKLPTYQAQCILPRGMERAGVEMVVEGNELPINPAWRFSPTPPPITARGETRVTPSPSGALVRWEMSSYRHGVHLQPFSISPVQIHPQTGRVWAASKMVLHLTLKPARWDDQTVTPRATHLDALQMKVGLREAAINPDALDPIALRPARALALEGPAPLWSPRSPTGAVDGVILCPENLMVWYQPIAEEKTRAGRPWEVVTYEWIESQAGYASDQFSDRAAKIRGFLKEAYQRYDLQYVLFGGDGPPRIDSVWDRAGYGDLFRDAGYNSPRPVPHRSFGYYTNLDHGDQTELVARGDVEVMYVILRDPAQFNPPYEIRWVTTTIDTVVPGFPRCGYAAYETELRFFPEFLRLSAILPAGVTLPFPLGTTLNALFTGVGGTTSDYGNPHAFLNQAAIDHPEWRGQEIVLGARSNLSQLSTFDHQPELLAGWLPPHPQLGPVGIGLYHSKVEAFLHPVDPTLAATVYTPIGLLASLKAQAAGWNVVLRSGQEAGTSTEWRRGFGAAFDNVPHCSQPSRSLWGHLNDWDTVSGMQRQAPQPSGLHAIYKCTSNGFQGGAYWDYRIAPLVMLPDAGPVVGIVEGFTDFGGYHDGSAFRVASFVAATDRPSMVRVAWVGDDGFSEYGVPLTSRWVSGHQTVAIGDPSLRLWHAPPEPVLLDLPVSIQNPLPVGVHDAGGAPLAGAVVVVSKRRPDGSYAYYRTQPTDAQGSVSFDLGELSALGTGVVNVEVDQYPIIPFRDFLPCHGAVPLPGNRPPVVTPNLPTEMYLTTQEGSWLVMDAGVSDDPDGDPVNYFWNWTDVRSGVPVARRVRGRYQRAFLPEGSSALTLTVGDGASATTLIQTLNVVRSPDTTPPVVYSSPPVSIPPLQRWVDVTVAVNQGGGGYLNFQAFDPPSPPSPTGILRWTLVGLSTNDPRVNPPVTASFAYSPGSGGGLGTGILRVRADLNEDGTVRIYQATIRVWDYSGNFSDATGEVRIVDVSPPIIGPAQYTRTEPASGTWRRLRVVMLMPPSSPIMPEPADRWQFLGYDRLFDGQNVEFRPLAGWRIEGVTVTYPEWPQAELYRVTGTTLEVFAEVQENGQSRTYTVSLTGWDDAGNGTRATGRIVFEDIRSPQITWRSPVTVSPSPSMVAVPIRVVAPGSPTLAGALEFEAWDDALPGNPFRPIAGFEVVEVTSNDPNVPSLSSWNVTGTTLWVKAESNSDETMRKYTVRARACDRSGNWSVPAVNTVQIAPSRAFAIGGRVQVLRDTDPPTIGLGVPGALVEVRDLNGSWTARTTTDFQGAWSLMGVSSGRQWASVDTRWQVSKGGGIPRYQWWDAVSGAYVSPVISLTGVVVFGRDLASTAHPPQVVWLEGVNTAPVARVTSGTLVAVTLNPTATVTLDGRPSSDLNNDLLIYQWTWTSGGASYTRNGPVIPAEFPQGVTAVTLTVSDGMASASTLVTVRVRQPFPVGGGGAQ